MAIFIGIVLFIIGTLAAFIAAIAGIAYLRTLSVYISMKKLYRILFGAGMLTIAALISVLIAYMLVSCGILETTEDVKAAQTPAAEFQIKEDEAKVEAEVVEVDNEVATEPNPDVEIENTPEPEIVKEESVVEPEVVEQPAATKSSMEPSFTAWKNIYNGHEYAYVEVENGVPYVYAPNYRGSFWYDLNNISSGRESGNIVVIANAGTFKNDSSPQGMVIQNGKAISAASSSDFARTLVIDETGNVGYTKNAIINGVVDYTDALTGKTVSGRRIVSAVYAFSPIVMNSKPATEYRNRVENYSAYRARSIFCVRGNRAFTIITNTGEGENGGGWNFDDMAEVAVRRGCVSAFNFDGGGSTALAWRTSINQGFQAYATTERHDPTFIVFTADNLAPSGK